jgi:hypothetical protein
VALDPLDRSGCGSARHRRIAEFSGSAPFAAALPKAQFVLALVVIHDKMYN